MFIADITVSSYRLTSRPRRVQYALNVRGLTMYLHPMALYDPDSCLSRDTAMFTHWKRFSSIAKMHKSLVLEFPSISLPKFPRHWFPVRSQKGILLRIAQLNQYFTSLLENEKVKHSQALSAFFQPSVTMTIRVVGVPGIGKMRVLEAFFAAGKERMKDGIPSLAEGAFLESGVYPDRSDVPVDVIVDQTLVRLSLITVLSFAEEDAIEKHVADSDGVIFAFSEDMPESFDSVRRVRRVVDIESAIIALDEKMDISRGQFSMTSVGDIYGVFEYIVERLLQKDRSHKYTSI